MCTFKATMNMNNCANHDECFGNDGVLGLFCAHCLG